MKKTLFIFLLFALNIIPAISATNTPWWLRPTVCKINPTNCYSDMTYGYLNEMGNPDSWDNTSNCWGLKLICPEALTTGDKQPVALERTEIERSQKINSDYDVNKLSATRDCFGIRKTSEGGAKVYVNGKLVNVWCSGILNKPDEILDNGEIMYDVQPTCQTLATNNFVAVENGTCYGKYYDTSKYHIECGSNLTPKRLIVLNGADYTTAHRDAPKTKDDADKVFDQMYSASKEQKSKYFAK